MKKIQLKSKKRVIKTRSNRTIVTREDIGELLNDSQISKNAEIVSDEWTSLKPTEKDMGLVHFNLDKGVSTTVIGTVYGLDFQISVKGCTVNVFFDYYNKRLKVLDYQATDFSALTKRLLWLALHNNFDKIFFKARKKDFQKFLSHGYVLEGVLRYYFNGEDAYVLSRFSSKKRAISSSLMEESELIEELIFNTEKKTLKKMYPGVKIVTADYKHIPQFTFIYRNIFATYPSPLTNPDYIKSTMDRNVLYKMAVLNGDALAVASAEINDKYSNAEMTDCATIPKAQGKGLMQHILSALEKDLKKRKISTAYTLSRAKSVSMNRVFFRLGYEYSGRLINNCDILGSYEDMNIGVKRV